MNESANESIKSVPKQFKRLHLGAVLAVIVLAVPFVYLAAMGPYVYFAELYYGSRGRVPGPQGQAVFGSVLEPANYVGEFVPRYRDYLWWFQGVAIDESIRNGENERAERGRAHQNSEVEQDR